MRNITQEDIEGRSLSAEEKGWLHQRGRHAEVELNEELYDGSTRLNRETGVNGEDNYDQWKIKELKEEGEGRVPPVDFTGCTLKEHFVLALRSWDLEHPEEDDTKE